MLNFRWVIVLGGGFKDLAVLALLGEMIQFGYVGYFYFKEVEPSSTRIDGLKLGHQQKHRFGTIYR